MSKKEITPTHTLKNLRFFYVGIFDASYNLSDSEEYIVLSEAHGSYFSKTG